MNIEPKRLRFALFGNEFQAKKSASILKVLSFLNKRKAEVFFDRAFYDFLTQTIQPNIEASGVFDGDDFQVDYVISLGGDGTFLKAAKGLSAIDGKYIATVAVAYVPVAFVVFAEHIADHKNLSSVIGKELLEDPGLHRTLLGDGIGSMAGAFFGGCPNTTYGENTGVLNLTKVYDPRVIRIAAVFAIVLSFCPKFSALIACMPASTIGGVSLVLYGMISAVGVRNVVENVVDFTKSRNVLILAFILVLAIGIKYGAGDSISLGFTSLSGLAVAALVGIILNAILPGKDYEFGSNPQGDKAVDFEINPSLRK